MSRGRERALTAAYVEAREWLMRILYEEDPGIMGITIGAPPDEYGSEAEILLADLKAAKTRSDIRAVLEAHFPNVSEDLVDRVRECWQTFRRKTQLQS
jgi:hypothetical protein